MSNRPFALCALIACLSSVPAAQSSLGEPLGLRIEALTEVIDPKLEGGALRLTALDPLGGRTTTAALQIWNAEKRLATPWTGTLTGGDANEITWDGRLADGTYPDVGTYEARLVALDRSVAGERADFHVVRLGITEIEAQDTAAEVDDEWQMVYFRKRGTGFSYYATPAIHEYLCIARPGQVSDLDRDDGTPRGAMRLHARTAQPVVTNEQYDTAQYNYPIAYLQGCAPRLEVTLGASSTTSAGQLQGVGYPLADVRLRLQLSVDGRPVATSGDVAPGGKVTFDTVPLPRGVTRTDREHGFSWQFLSRRSGTWVDVPGSFTVRQRFYTTLGKPIFGEGVRDARHAGPWVEVADYEATWAELLEIDTSTFAGLVESHVKGFFGQTGPIEEAIEGVLYDAYPVGGDGGATHYFDWGTWEMGLSRLLHNHSRGVYVNCTDNMGSTATMLAMMGVPNMRPVRLGGMDLKAIWGIGTEGYTTDLWGGAHGFSYHHIVTRDDGVHVSDTCMQLDGDEDPGSTPGFPGWNHDRRWSGVDGYNQLSSYDNVSRDLEALPNIY